MPYFEQILAESICQEKRYHSVRALSILLLPYTIDTSSLSAEEKGLVEQLNLSPARALCVTELANQMVREYDSGTTNRNKIGDESLQLLYFSLGLWQYAINSAKSMFDNHRNQGSDTIFRNSVRTIGRFLQTRYSDCLASAVKMEETRSESEESRCPQRIIYETSITTAKHGAKSELQGISYHGLYKTSVLLLQALLQPPFDDTVEKLDEEDCKLVQGFLNQLYVRLHHKNV
jgi:hypothetical protein